MRDFFKNYWVSITLVLCTVAILTTEFLIFPLWEEFFGLGYIVILLTIFLLAFAVNDEDDRVFKTFLVSSYIAPFLQMGLEMYLFPMKIWPLIILGVLCSCIGIIIAVVFATNVPKIIQLRRDLHEQMLRNHEQYRIERKAYLAKQKRSRKKREKEAKKKRHSYQGKPVTFVRSKIIRVDEESGGYMIYLEQDNIHYYIFKRWLKRDGKKMLASPKIGSYATLYFSGPENTSAVACYIGGKCRYKADGFEEY